MSELPLSNLRLSDWLLIGAWLVFIVALGPFLFSARNTLVVLFGFLILCALLNFSFWRLYPIIKRKFQ